MANSLADRRVQLVRAFASKAVELPRLEHTRLRYSLGTSTSELRVPFHVAPDVRRIFTQSASQLALMLVSRHRTLLGAEFERFMLSDPFDSLPTAPLTLAAAQGGPDILATCELAASAHVGLTGGVMAAWLGAGGGGRSLVALIIAVLRRAFGEGSVREETATLAALMLSSMLPDVERALTSIVLPAGPDLYLRAAAGAGVFLAIRLGVERVLREVKADQHSALRVEAVFSPAVLFGGRPAMFGGNISLYGCELTAGILDADRLMTLFSAPEGTESVTAALRVQLDADAALSRRAEAAVAMTALRRTLLEVAREGELGAVAPEPTEFFRELAINPQRLPLLLSDEKARKELAKDLSRLPEPTSDRARDGLGALIAGLKSYKEKEPGACLGLSRREARDRYATAGTAALADLWLERALEQIRRALEARTGDENEGGLDVEYAGGRLYRVTTGEGPILRPSVTPDMGHLFVDVKDFTRRTSLLGQSAIAEFLRREFYLPILNSAKKHFGGMSHLADKGGVTVNNLLGDALSLSGDIIALVALAHDIRQQLDSYQRQLAKVVSSEAVAKAVRAIEEEYEKKARLAGPDNVQLQAERETALSRAKGEGLEAGVFISFGPAPTVIQIDDEVFGRSRVAIADRINESARGTARSGGARARADALLARERARRNDRAVAHPWLVFVGAPMTIHVPPEIEELARATMKRADFSAAFDLISGSMREQLEAALEVEDRFGDIYNAGAALSDEALLAFRAAVGARRSFREIDVAPQQLHSEILRRYCFPPESIRLTVAFNEAGSLTELFRYAGKVMFKGLETGGGIGVWEIVSGAGVAALLARYHAVQWHRGQPTAGY